MKKSVIVVIDTGVDNSHSIFTDNPIRGINIRYGCENTIICDNNMVDEIGHGTAVCGILRKNCPDAEIFMVKIYQKDLITEEELLIKSLEYIDLHIKCNIINMSLGILSNSEELHNICKKLRNKGCVLVAAFDNTGAVSYPAAYGEVLGVDASVKCIYPEDYIYVENSIVNLYAKSGNTRLAWIEQKSIIGRGVSYSAAFMTAIIANILEQNKKNLDVDELDKELRKKALKIYKFEKSEKSTSKCKSSHSIDCLKRAAIFPYNKEIHSLINFPDLLSFQIEGIYDIKQHGYINKTIKSIDEKYQYAVKDYMNMNFEDIDSVIIGHTTEISHLLKTDVKKIILDYCLMHQKNVYCFDGSLVDLYKQKFIEEGLRLDYPVVNYVNNQKMGKLYGIGAPVLGVFGTSSAQGKYTLQLQLRRMFIESGYKVGQLGSEPSALLFGMDEVFPFGYERTIELADRQFLETVNSLIHIIDEKNPDIIIVGCQANTVPRIMYNTNHASLPQLEFLLGSNPDVVILCVNLFDEIEYINRSILAIENMVECKVAGLAISPFYYPSEWHIFNNKKEFASKQQIDEFKRNIHTQLNLNSYVIGTEEIADIFNLCIDFLS